MFLSVSLSFLQLETQWIADLSLSQSLSLIHKYSLSKQQNKSVKNKIQFVCAEGRKGISPFWTPGAPVVPRTLRLVCLLLGQLKLLIPTKKEKEKNLFAGSQVSTMTMAPHSLQTATQEGIQIFLDCVHSIRTLGVLGTQRTDATIMLL